MRPSAVNITAESMNGNDINVEGQLIIRFAQVYTVELDQSELAFLDGRMGVARRILRTVLDSTQCC